MRMHVDAVLQELQTRKIPFTFPVEGLFEVEIKGHHLRFRNKRGFVNQFHVQKTGTFTTERNKNPRPYPSRRYETLDAAIDACMYEQPTPAPKSDYGHVGDIALVIAMVALARCGMRVA